MYGTSHQGRDTDVAKNMPIACKDLAQAMHFSICGGTMAPKAAISEMARQLKVT